MTAAIRAQSADVLIDGKRIGIAIGVDYALSDDHEVSAFTHGAYDAQGVFHIDTVVHMTKIQAREFMAIFKYAFERALWERYQIGGVTRLEYLTSRLNRLTEIYFFSRHFKQCLPKAHERRLRRAMARLRGRIGRELHSHVLARPGATS